MPRPLLLHVNRSARRVVVPVFEYERFRVRVDGRSVAGGVATVVRRRGSGRVVDRCDTGAVGFDAQL